MDILAVTAALVLSYRLRQANVPILPGYQFGDAASLPPFDQYLSAFVSSSVLLFLVLAAMLGLYTLRSTLSAWREVWLSTVSSVLWLVLIIAWYILVLQQIFFSRAILLYGVTAMAVFVVLGRAALTIFQRSLLRAGIGRKLVVSIGDQHPVDAALQTLEEDIRYSYLGHLPHLDALKRLMHQRTVDLIIQTDPNPGSEQTIALINYCRSHHVGYGYLPPVLADVPHQLQVEKLGLLPLIRFQPTPLDGWGKVWKRVSDILVSGIAILILSPLFLLIAIAILIDTGWPVFYVSRRVGDQGRKGISVLKFRSMVRGADAQKERLLLLNHRKDGPLFKVKDDPRVTRSGKILRRTSLDELPQLLNVFLGQMSLVGPRPHLPEEVARYSLEQRRVFAVKPGITGLAQVSGRSDLSFEEEVKLDLQYIEEWSIVLDMWILWRTIFTIVSRRGAD
jgi:exopolysaccharide biosynthesis polyprenyl glycosylphosphotransferase